MANETNNTDLASAIPQNWRPRFVSAVYDDKKVTDRVLNAMEDYQDHNGKGDIANISVEGFTLTVNSVGADGSLTVQEKALTNVALSVNQWKEVTIELLNKTRKQAFSIWEDQFPVSAGAALRENIEATLLAEYTNASLAAQGDGTGNLGEDELLGAIQTHVSAKLKIMDNPEEFTFVLPDTQFAPLKKANLLDYTRTGQAGQGGAASIDLPRLWNVPVVFSTQAPTSAGKRYGLLLHKTALAWAAQQNVQPEMASRLPAGKLTWIMTVSALYGVKTVVGGRMCQLVAKA